MPMSLLPSARTLVLFVILVLAALRGGAGHAQTPLIALDTTDAGRDFAAVGRLDLDGRGFCTATLVAEDLVLTAAHCLFDRRSGARLPLAGLTFMPGFRNGSAAAYRAVRRAAVDPRYRLRDPDPVTRVGADLALLELSQPIRVAGIAPLGVAERTPGLTDVSVVSYAREREQAPSLERSCSVLTEEERAQVLSCDVDFGASGAPVFRSLGGVPELVAVVSAKAVWEGRRVALASRIEDRVGRLADLLAPDGPEPGRVMAGSAVGTAGRVMQGGSAVKFLRP